MEVWRNLGPTLHFPRLCSTVRRAGCRKPPCHFYCAWLRPQRGEFAKPPHSNGIGAFGTTLFGSVCALTGRLVVLKIAQVGCCLSLQVSQPARGRSTTKSYRRKKGRWKKRWRMPAPKPWLQRDFRGALSSLRTPLCLRGSPGRQHPCLPFPWEFRAASRTPELCWATASYFQAFFPADYSDMMSFLLRQD